MIPAICYDGSVEGSISFRTGECVNVSYMQIDSMLAVPVHTQSYYEFYFLYSGIAEHETDAGVRALREGSLTFTQPGEVHGFLNLSSDIRSVNFALQSDMFERFTDRIGGEVIRRFLADEGRSIQLEPQSAQCLMNAALIRTTLRQAGPLSDLLVTSSLGQAILFGKLNRFRRDMPAWLDEVVRAWQFPAMYVRPIDELYAMCNHSKEHVCRSFQKYMGMTPTRFVNELRLGMAKLQLCTTRDTVLEISLRCGFENLSNFNHLFKRSLQCTPTEYRRRFREERAQGEKE